MLFAIRLQSTIINPYGLGVLRGARSLLMIGFEVRVTDEFDRVIFPAIEPATFWCGGGAVLVDASISRCKFLPAASFPAFRWLLLRCCCCHRSGDSDYPQGNGKNEYLAAFGEHENFASLPQYLSAPFGHDAS